MRLRKLTAAALAVLAVTGLSACKSNAGAAAVVDGHRISDSDVAKYVNQAGPDAQRLSQAAAQGQTLPPLKPTVASYLVQEQVYVGALDRTGDVPDAGALAALHDRAAAALLGAQSGGAEFDKLLTDEIVSDGFTHAFAGVVIRVAELKWALIERVKANQLSELIAAVDKLKISVSVSPRYGKWNPAQLTLAGPETTIPGFLTLTGTSSAGSQVSTG